MRRILLSTLILLVFSFSVRAQHIQVGGSITNEKREPIPFATVYIQNANYGTAANSEGEYQLRVPAGKYVIVVRAVGYKQTSKSVEIKESMTVDFQLETEAYALEEIVIGNAEDPAYRIIRRAIANRKKNQSAADPYTAKVYIKGVQRLLKAPKSFLGVDIDQIGREIGLDSNRAGIVYLSESESKITVRPPKDFKEEMISSKISGNNQSFSFNRASDLKLDFYDNHQVIFEGLSARPFVSPIADNALSYYRYKLLGTVEEGGRTINKIQVVPRRRADPVYEGDIYIVEDSWRIHGINLLLTKESGINILDSLRIKQDFIPVGTDQWYPANVHFDFVGGLFSFRFGGYFAAVFSDYALNPDVEKHIFREVLRVEEGVNEKDSAYWEANRALALTDEEALDYARKDSLRLRRESKSYLDSLDKVSNKFKPLSFVTGGYTHRNRAKSTYLSFDGLLNSALYNTVEGMALNYGTRYSKRIDSVRNRYFHLYGHARYGFKNKRFNGDLGTSIPVGRGTLSLSGGSQVNDLNNREPLSSFFNTVNSLFFGRNYLKLYERQFGQVQWNHTLPGNIHLFLSGTWENRRWLPNSTDYTFFDRNQQYITSNNPFTPDVDLPLFEENKALKASLTLIYDFGTRYESYPNRKVYLPSKFPTLQLTYLKGIPNALGSEVDFDLLRAVLHKNDIGLGLYGHFSFMLSGGGFLNNNRLSYVDYRHFSGTQTRIMKQAIYSYLLLDYYTHSTAGNFLEAHTEYNLSTLLTSKVPLLRKFKIKEIIGLHYLSTSEIPHYGEMHAGLEWNFLRVMYARSFGTVPAMRGRDAIRIGFSLF